jgi:adenylate cyclase
MGYYFTSDRDGRVNGALAAPVMGPRRPWRPPYQVHQLEWIRGQHRAAGQGRALGGFFNSITEGDGVVRSIPLLAEYKGQYYESLALAMFRMLAGLPKVEPGFPPEKFLTRNYQGLESILLKQGRQNPGDPGR